VVFLFLGEATLEDLNLEGGSIFLVLRTGLVDLDLVAKLTSYIT